MLYVFIGLVSFKYMKFDSNVLKRIYFTDQNLFLVGRWGTGFWVSQLNLS